jgi:hypothetical protein
MDPKFVVNLSGKDYPLWGGILAEAHERGLQSIETQLVQVPSDENGRVAIVKAMVTMKDGARFEEYGDACPENVNQKVKLHLALIRMASTRAKGRALRDACNIGQTMLEELPDLEEVRQESRGDRYAREMPSEKWGPKPAPIAGAQAAPPKEEPMKVRYSPGTPEGEAAMAGTGRVRAGEGGEVVCGTPGCGKPLTRGQIDVSTQRFGQALCPTCQRAQTIGAGGGQ